MEYQSRSLLDRHLTDLRDKTQQLTSMVLAAIDLAMTALMERDPALAHEVIVNDAAVNELRYDIEEACVLTLATQQPLASDLRLIIAASHIAGELERIGDHATSIADIVERVAGEEPFESFHKLPKMAKHGSLMVQQSIEAFIERDVDMAREIVRREEKLDKHYQRLFDETIYNMRDDDYIRRGTYLLWAGRHLERIGDRATNIAERVIFLTTGEFVEIA